MFARYFATLRCVIAVLALLGQVTPLVALPVSAIAGPKIGVGCAAAACACAPVEKVLTGCCCSKPEAPVPAPKSCCEAPAKPKKKASCYPTDKPAAQPTVTKALPAAPKAAITSGGTCKCDKPTKAVTAEPAVPPTDATAVAVGSVPEALSSRRASLVTSDPLPPPYPPPRAG